MNITERDLAGKIITLIKPVFLLTIIMFYFLGGGIYKYLGGIIDWVRFSGGLTCTILLHISCQLLNAFFDMHDNENPQSEYRHQKSNKSQIEKKYILSAGLITFASGSVFFLVFVNQNEVSAASLLVYFVALLTCIVYSVPPFKLTSRGMGEIAQTILITNLYPAFSFLLQNGEMHRLVAMITFPLTLLFLAGYLSNELSTYLQDMLTRNMTLLQVLQWKMGMNLHNALILFSYLIVGIAVLFGLSWSLTWPFLIPLPLSLLSIYEVMRIQSGLKPRWSVLLLGSYGATGCTIYLITFALWTS